MSMVNTTQFVPGGADGMEHCNASIIDNIRSVCVRAMICGRWRFRSDQFWNRAKSTVVVITGTIRIPPPRQLNLWDYGSRVVSELRTDLKLQHYGIDKLQALRLRARLRGF